MKKKYNSVEGFKSIYPKEWGKWKRVREIVEETVKTFGFKEISTPSIEKEELYKVKPPWSEGMLEETFSFNDNRGEKLTLIPEQTPTRARMVQEKERVEPPVRWFNTSKRWRQEEELTEDRAREFWQTDIDIIGEAGPKVDAEILACAAKIYERLGLSDSVKLLVSDRKLIENVLKEAGLKEDDFYEAVGIIDDKEKITEEEFRKRFSSLGLKKKEVELISKITSLNLPLRKGVEKLRKEYEKLSERSEEILNRLSTLSGLLEVYGIYERCEMDLSIARGSFYTGIIFEVFDENKSLGALSGGGRYDWLVGMYGSRDLPAIGFGFGHLGTVQKLKKEGLFNKSLYEKSVLISSRPGIDYKEVVKLAEALRMKNLPVELETENTSRKTDRFRAIIDLEKAATDKKKIKLTCGKKEKFFKNKKYSRMVNEIINFLNKL